MTNASMTAVFLTVYFMFPVVLWVCIGRWKLSPFILNIESYLLIKLFLTSYIGLLPLYFELDPYRVSLGLRNDGTLISVMVSSIWAITMVAAGMSVVRGVLPGRPDAASVWSLTTGQLVVTTVMIVVCFGVMAAYLSRFETIALFSAVTGDASQAAVQRSVMTNDFQGKYHRYSWFMHDVLWCVNLALLAALLSKPGRVVAVLFTVTFAGMIFATTMSAQKAPLVWYLVSLAFLYITTKHRGQINPWWAIGLVLATLAAITTIYIIIYNRDFIWSFSRVISRAFTGQITPAFAYMQYFPKYHEFLLGGSFPNPGSILPHNPFHLTVEIMNWMAPQQAERGVVGSSPTVFWGEAYANFGFWGIAIMPFFVGLWVGTVSGVVRSLPHSPLVAGFAVWLAFHFSGLASTGVFTFVADTSLVVVSSMMASIVGVGWMLDRFVFERSHEKKVKGVRAIPKPSSTTPATAGKSDE